MVETELNDAYSFRIGPEINIKNVEACFSKFMQATPRLKMFL